MTSLIKKLNNLKLDKHEFVLFFPLIWFEKLEKYEIDL